MKYYRDLFNQKINELEHGSYITIGAFDGVHKGHQQLISNVVREGEKNNYVTVVITFDPLPKVFLSNKNLQAIRLTNSYTRADRIAALGIDILIEYTFDQNFSNISHNDFINNILLNLNPKKFFVGKDFRFGYKGLGNPSILKRAGLRFGFEVEILEDFIDLNNERISSTRVRQAIKSGDFKLATELMGKPHEISGSIIQMMNSFRMFFIPNGDIILPAKGEYITNIVINDVEYPARAKIFDINKPIEIILDNSMINIFPDNKVVLQFLDSVMKTEEIRLEHQIE